MKSEDYQKLFEVQGLRFLVNDIWMTHYKHLNALTIVIDDLYKSYLPKEMVKITLAQGLDLFSDNEKFEEYRNNFLNFKKEVYNVSKELFNLPEIKIKHLHRYLELLSECFKYYSKTEFFYTDKAYSEMQKDGKDSKNLKINLPIQGEIKNKGRELFNDIFFGEEGYLNLILKKICKQFELSFEDIQWYSKQELLDLYLGNKVSSDILEKRKKGFVMKGIDNQIEIFIGEDALAIEKEFNQKDVSNIEGSHVKGTVANKVGGSKNKIIAKAKVIHIGYDIYDKLPEIINNMEKGEVLVAETTSPELFLACEKASAIVTNQGGLLSHAAIVSREFGIPCIVGTGNATKVIKTGDLIEVDANEGIVRKLPQE